MSLIMSCMSKNGTLLCGELVMMNRSLWGVVKLAKSWVFYSETWLECIYIRMLP